MRICPGKMSVEESLAALRANAQKATSIGANGNCMLRYHIDGKKKKDGPFATTLRVDPPRHMYLQINVAFDPTGIVAGANDEEFWLAIKPKEMSGYWHGRWSEVGRSERLLFNPKVMLEALGIADVGEGGEANWSLSNEGPFDILVLRDSAGMMAKRVYVYSCEYVVRKIEYFDVYGQPEVTADLGRYVQVVEGFSVPTMITISYRTEMGEDSAKFTLSTPKAVTLSEKQMRGLFNPPKDIDRFKDKRELINGEWVDR